MQSHRFTIVLSVVRLVIVAYQISVRICKNQGSARFMPDLCHILSPLLDFFLLLILKVLVIGRWERLKYFPT